MSRWRGRVYRYEADDVAQFTQPNSELPYKIQCTLEYKTKA